MKLKLYISLLTIALSCAIAFAQDSQAQSPENNGIEVGFGLTNIYQRTVKGGESTNSRKGEFSGSYDIEIDIDAEKLFGFDGGSFFIHGQGGWSDSEGVDSATLGSYFGTNADAGGNRSFDIIEFFYASQLSENSAVYIGKIDFTGYFDGNKYANDETRQFLNGSLVNNPAIPFPDYSLGIIYHQYLDDIFCITAGVADAQADGRETGFDTAFDGNKYWFYIAEIAATTQIQGSNGSLPGAYRFGIWNDPRPKANSDSSKEYRDDTGFYLSFDQKLYNEYQSEQGLGAFFRYGWANQKRNDMSNFFSFGLSYTGLFDQRENDIFGIGYANGCFSDGADVEYREDFESVIETYYSIQINDYLAISPNLQFVKNAGGSNETSDAIVLGLRGQINF